MTKYQTLRTIPLKVLRTRLSFVRRLEFIFSDAMRKREQHCDENGLNWRTPYISKHSEDRVHDDLFKRYIHYHCEYLTLRVNISALEKEVTRLTNRKVYGYEYDGAIAELTR